MQCVSNRMLILLLQKLLVWQKKRKANVDCVAALILDAVGGKEVD